MTRMRESQKSKKLPKSKLKNKPAENKRLLKLPLQNSNRQIEVVEADTLGAPTPTLSILALMEATRDKAGTLMLARLMIQTRQMPTLTTEETGVAAKFLSHPRFLQVE